MKRNAAVLLATLGFLWQGYSEVHAQLGLTSNRRYAGRSLAQWHELLKDIDPKSSNAIGLVDPLIEIVKDDNVPGVDREPFAAYLARIGTPAQRAVPVFAGMINRRHDNSSTDYMWAARALALMGEPGKEATPALVDLLFDDRLPVSHRQSALEAIALIGSAHPDAIPALLQLLQYRESRRVTATDAAFLRHLAAESIFIVGPGAEIAAPLLIRMIRDPRESEQARRSAIVAIGSLQSRGAIAVHALSEELVAGRSPALRDAAAEALVKIGEAAMPTILRSLEHLDPGVRWRVAFHLRILAVPAGVIRPKLTELLDDSEAIVRISAAESAVRLWDRSDKVITNTISLLREGDRTIRFRAKKLLVSLKPLGPQHIEQLRQLVLSDKKYVAMSAGATLHQLLQEE